MKPISGTGYDYITYRRVLPLHIRTHIFGGFKQLAEQSVEVSLKHKFSANETKYLLVFIVFDELLEQLYCPR